MAYVVQTDELKMKRAGESDHHEGGSAISILGSKDESRIFNAHLQSYARGGATHPHQHDDREQYFYVLEGEGTFTVGGKEFSVRPGLVRLHTGEHRALLSHRSPGAQVSDDAGIFQRGRDESRRSAEPIRVE